MPAVPTRFPRRSRTERTPDLPVAISDVSGRWTSAATATTGSPCSRASKHLGLVGDREVGAAGGDLLDRRGRVGRARGLARRARPRGSSPARSPRRSRRGRGSGTSRAPGRACAARRCRVDRLGLLAAAGSASSQRSRASERDGDGASQPASRRSRDRPTARRGARRAPRARTGRSPSRTRISTAANTRAVRSCAVPTWIACPRPASEPTSSPNTAPITATATATFAPENRYGSDGGQLQAAEHAPAGGAQRAQHLDLVAVDRARGRRAC